MRKRNFWWLAVAGVGALAAGCEGYRTATGTLRDAATGTPLDSVRVTVLTRSDDARVSYTDSTGFFDVQNRMSGCVPKCKEIRVEFSKAGYQSTVIENPDDTVEILLRP